MKKQNFKAAMFCLFFIWVVDNFIHNPDGFVVTNLDRFDPSWTCFSTFYSHCFVCFKLVPLSNSRSKCQHEYFRCWDGRKHHRGKATKCSEEDELKEKGWKQTKPTFRSKKAAFAFEIFQSLSVFGKLSRLEMKEGKRIGKGKGIWITNECWRMWNCKQTLGEWIIEKDCNQHCATAYTHTHTDQDKTSAKSENS